MPNSPRHSVPGPWGALPGFVAAIGGGVIDDVAGAGSSVTAVTCGPVTMAHWGLSPLGPGQADTTLALSRVARNEHGTVPQALIADTMRRAPAELARLLPPFAAARGDESGVAMVADSMGFRQLYHSTPDASGAPVLSTSALFAGWARAAAIDHTAVAVQSLLGWQLGQRTIFTGIEKLAPGAAAHLTENGVRVSSEERASEAPLSLDEAVQQAASLLRDSLNALLDDHPDAVLQLTGGQDSRLLLSAIPVARRRGLRAMTLGVPGNGDVVVAERLAKLFALNHEVHGLHSLDDLGSGEAWWLAQRAAVRLDGMADPIAHAALEVAERGFDQGVRISGLGGEVARGFYYVGTVREREFTSKAAGDLASWRMFANEAVEAGLLHPKFSAWARATASNEVATIMADTGSEWFHATDELYLRHRMQRWAGVTDTAVGADRIVINPMLSEEFLAIASRLRPEDKAHSRFLARLQMQLDPTLGRIPLEGRPTPLSMAHPNAWSSAARVMSTGRRLSRKAVQRISRSNRAPAGGFVLAAKVVEHWRAQPEILSHPELSTFVQPDWIDGVLDGRITPRPSSVALVTNLIVATSGVGVETSSVDLVS